MRTHNNTKVPEHTNLRIYEVVLSGSKGAVHEEAQLFRVAGRSLFQRLPTKVWEVAVEDAMHRVQLEALPTFGWQRSWHRHADGCARYVQRVLFLRRHPWAAMPSARIFLHFFAVHHLAFTGFLRVQSGLRHSFAGGSS